MDPAIPADGGMQRGSSFRMAADGLNRARTFRPSRAYADASKAGSIRMARYLLSRLAR